MITAGNSLTKIHPSIPQSHQFIFGGETFLPSPGMGQYLFLWQGIVRKRHPGNDVPSNGLSLEKGRGVIGRPGKNVDFKLIKKIVDTKKILQNYSHTILAKLMSWVWFSQFFWRKRTGRICGRGRREIRKFQKFISMVKIGENRPVKNSTY